VAELIFKHSNLKDNLEDSFEKKRLHNFDKAKVASN
jgi:hypothetical protein